MVVGVGFEPTYATRADLQSAAFNHSATPPELRISQSKEILAKKKCFCELRKLSKFVNREVYNAAKKIKK
jgi:hypothetical protein